MKSLSVGSGSVPDSGNCAGSLNEFWEEVKPADISGESLFTSSLPNTFYFLVVSRVGVSLGDLYVEVQYLMQESFCPIGEFGGQELRKLFI